MMQSLPLYRYHPLVDTGDGVTGTRLTNVAQVEVPVRTQTNTRSRGTQRRRSPAAANAESRCYANQICVWGQRSKRDVIFLEEKREERELVGTQDY